MDGAGRSVALPARCRHAHRRRLCAEIGDFERFARAEQLMSYLGLVPCEITTGQQRRLGSITKTGSGHARRLLVEAAWHYRTRPAIGKALTDRQDDQPPEAIAIAWSAQRRLHRTWTRLEPAPSAARSSRSPPPASSPASAGRSPKSSEPTPTHRLIPSAGSVAARHARGTRDTTYEQPAPPRAGHARS